MNEKGNPIFLNYFYFGGLFLFLSSIQIYHIVLMGSSGPFFSFAYIVMSLLESLIEVAVLAFISGFLLAKKKKQFHRLFLCCVALFSLLSLVDFAIIRLMDVSAWRWIELVFQETLGNFIEMLHAANITFQSVVFVFLGLLAFFACNLWVFSVLNSLSKRKNIPFSGKHLFGVVVLALLALGSMDLLLYLKAPLEQEVAYVKALPWKRSLLNPKENIIEMKGSLKIPRMDQSSLEGFDSDLFSLERKSDIFLFVAESLRDDFLTETVSPNLARFRSENLRFEKALSNANGTHKSWFSLFYSLYPFYWNQYVPGKWEKGPLPLSLFKKMGYEIHVYASSRLSYYGMDEALFGKKGCLVDHLYEFRSEVSLSPSTTDQRAVEKMCQDACLQGKKGGRLFIVFLEATHFDYSWPDDGTELFASASHQINYLEMIGARTNLEHVKNRYKNAVHYLDDLFGVFEKQLKQAGLWNEAAIIFTADHGEEFNEHGCIFHASGLSLPQLKIPLYMKLGSGEVHPSIHQDQRASQVDIFPTLLHYVTGSSSLSPIFQGHSLLSSEKKNYVVGTRYNASQPPYEFYIQKEGYRVVVEFCNKKDIFRSRALKVKSIFDAKEEKVPFSPHLIQTHFGDVLDHLFAFP